MQPKQHSMAYADYFASYCSEAQNNWTELTVAVSHLVLVEEGLLGLVDLARDDLAGAGGARAGAARVGEVDAGLLGGVDDEDVVGALDGLVDVVLLGDELDGVAEAGGGAGGGVDGREGGGRGEEGGEGDEAEHGCGWYY